MTKRLFEDNDAWAPITSQLNNELETLLGEALVKLEADLGAPVDLRDFHYVGATALAALVTKLSVRRRLNNTQTTTEQTED